MWRRKEKNCWYWSKNSSFPCNYDFIGSEISLWACLSICLSVSQSVIISFISHFFLFVLTWNLSNISHITQIFIFRLSSPMNKYINTYIYPLSEIRWFKENPSQDCGEALNRWRPFWLRYFILTYEASLSLVTLSHWKMLYRVVIGRLCDHKGGLLYRGHTRLCLVSKPPLWNFILTSKLI